MIDYIIGIGIAIIVLIIIINGIKKRKRGETCCGCSSCPAAKECHKRHEN